MSFHQDIVECPEDPACTLIRCYTDDDVLDHESGEVIHPAGTVVWESHGDSRVAAEGRINPDVAAFHKGERLTARPLTDEESELLGGVL
jgi:hypothetical protein